MRAGNLQILAKLLMEQDVYWNTQTNKITAAIQNTKVVVHDGGRVSTKKLATVPPIPSSAIAAANLRIIMISCPPVPLARRASRTDRHSADHPETRPPAVLSAG
jgi:hypothetical protein